MILWSVSVVSVPGLLLSWVIHLLWIKPVTELQLVWVWNWSMNLINSKWIIDIFEIPVEAVNDCQISGDIKIIDDPVSEKYNSIGNPDLSNTGWPLAGS